MATSDIVTSVRHQVLPNLKSSDLSLLIFVLSIISLHRLVYILCK
jgi:hypothetical protein